LDLRGPTSKGRGGASRGIRGREGRRKRGGEEADGRRRH